MAGVFVSAWGLAAELRCERLPRLFVVVLDEQFWALVRFASVCAERCLASGQVGVVLCAVGAVNAAVVVIELAPVVVVGAGVGVVVVSVAVGAGVGVAVVGAGVGVVVVGAGVGWVGVVVEPEGATLADWAPRAAVPPIQPFSALERASALASSESRERRPPPVLRSLRSMEGTFQPPPES
jgi:hypothetical protein